MPELDIVARGIIIGLTAAVPVGPMAILCIRHTLTSGLLPGITFGAGIAAADTTYAAIAALGVSAVTSVLSDHESLIRFIGGAFMVVLGLPLLHSARGLPPGPTGETPASRGIRDAVFAFALTMTNPMTIIVFAALIAGYGFAFASSGQSAILLASGVFAGSMGWWIVLASAVALVRLKTTSHWMTRINLASGAVIIILGIIAIGASIQ